MSYKRRRRRTTARRSSTRAAGVLVVAASLMMSSSSAYGEDAQPTTALQDNNDEQLRMPHDNSNGGGHDHAIEYEDETSSSNFHRRLQLSAAQTFASFTSEDIAHAIPLDLMIDEGSGHAYIQGRAGYLSSYGQTFAQGGVVDGGGDGPKYLDSHNVLHVDNIIQEGNSNNGDNNLHVESMHRIPPPRRPDRLYYNKDGADDNSNSGHSRGLRGASRNKDGGGGPNVVHLVDITFGDFEEEEGDESESFPEGGDINEEGEEEDDDDEVDFTLSHKQEGRSLQRFSHSGFVSSRGPHEEDDTQDSINQHQMTPHRNKKQDNNNKNKIGTSQTRKKVPTITKIRPRPNVSVGNANSFVAKVLRSRSTKSPLKTVSFQLQNSQGSKSDPIDMTDIGDDTFEVTIDGFDKHKGTTWCFQISAKDVRGKKRNSDCIPFTVEGVGGSSNSFIVDDGDEDQDDIEKAPPTPEAKLMTQKEVSESDWNAGGEIKASTVRILFKFKKSGDQVFVCSGAVVRDGSRGETSDMNDGRTIIVTAGHCVYSDLYKEFASEALIIPDQSSTRGSKSDFDCKNDNLGCWVASWGTVAKDWTKGTFPLNVPNDYGYYTVYNDRSTHSGGYAPRSHILEEAVKPMIIDFDTKLDNDFVHSLGYSAEKDPSIRYCAEKNTVINGVPWYKNYWLDVCAMSGGASGGPWVQDMNEEGVGRIVSINSWGFSHRDGMAGPSFETKGGSWAECLFDKARKGSDPGRQGGHIVTDC